MAFDLNNPRVLYLLASLLLLVLLLQFVISPFFSSVDRLELEVKQQQRVNVEMEGLVAQLEALRSQGKQKKSDKAVVTSLLPWLEKETAAAGLKKSVKQISSVNLQKGDLYRERATLRMKELDIQRLLRFIDKLEKTPGLKVIRSDIRRGTEKKPGLALFVELGRF